MTRVADFVVRYDKCVSLWIILQPDNNAVFSSMFDVQVFIFLETDDKIGELRNLHQVWSLMKINIMWTEHERPDQNDNKWIAAH